MGEEINSKSKKKVIKVRKLQTNNENPGPSETVSRHSSHLSTESYSYKLFSPDRINGSTDQEEELQIIDFDESSSCSSKHPIEFMFPHLSQEGVDINNLTRTLPTNDLTRLLTGHKANFSNIYNQTRRRNAIDFTPILERIEDESSVESIDKPIKKCKKIDPQRPRLDSADADVEDSDSEET
ncbi:hypothetical protein HUJ04_002558 [Dendroctonus ponderosae]|nr:hypothetical protein HUJ04_002558 [Dendroctonus ponderosae]KAH1024521.1 hypothetical protein HUJ05_003988 [Dendroctonus ponderosae]